MQNKNQTEIPYLLKLSGAVTPTSPTMIQMALSVSMKAYMHMHKLSLSEYAKKVGVNRYTIIGIQKDIISLDQVKFGELYRLLTFHGYNVSIQVEQKQPVDGVNDPFCDSE